MATMGLGLGASAFAGNEDQKSDLQEEYDFIVVGSGAGGGPLSCNLAKAGFSVLLLEAGSRDDKSEVREVPIFHTAASEDENFRGLFMPITIRMKKARFRKKTLQTRDCKMVSLRWDLLSPRFYARWQYSRQCHDLRSTAQRRF